MRFTYLLLTLFIFLSCSSDMKVVKEFDDKGILLTEYELDKKSNTKNGFYKTYYPDGSTREISQYIRDTLHGVRILFSQSGEKEVEENYLYGIFHGPFQSYYHNGSINVKGTYVNGAMEGLWERYYDTGEKMEVTTFKNNEENGPFSEYYKNGNVKAEGTYINGPFEHGELKLYDEDGVLIKKMDCNNGICVTSWTKE